MISIKSEGNFKKTNKYFTKTIKILKLKDIDKVAKRCIDRLKDATPKRTGLTANSWKYKIIRRKDSVDIRFYNTNNQNGVNVVLLLEYGHMTRGGTWVYGERFIDPAIKKSYNEILDSTWKEMTEL